MLKYDTYSCIYSRPEEMFQVFSNIGLTRDTFEFCPEMDRHNTELPVGFTIRGGLGIRNALEMICWAGIGVAMGNACDDLKRVADHICAPSWADGIAQSVEKLLLSSNASQAPCRV